MKMSRKVNTRTVLMAISSTVKMSYIQKAIDKSVIEAGKSQKYLHVYTTV